MRELSWGTRAPRWQRTLPSWGKDRLPSTLWHTIAKLSTLGAQGSLLWRMSGTERIEERLWELAELCSQAGHWQHWEPWSVFHNWHTKIWMGLYQSTLDTALPPKDSQEKLRKATYLFKWGLKNWWDLGVTWPNLFIDQPGGWDIFDLCCLIADEKYRYR